MHNQATNLQDAKRLDLMQADRVLEWLLPAYSQCRCWQESMGLNFKGADRVLQQFFPPFLSVSVALFIRIAKSIPQN
jgi:hypothetical protein